MMKRNLFHSKHKWLKPCAILTCTAVLFWWVMAFPFADVPLYAATDETAITGDMNHDKIVNSTDLTLLKYAILKNDNTMLKYGDMTGDGVLNKDDAILWFSGLCLSATQPSEHRNECSSPRSHRDLKGVHDRPHPE